MKKTALEKIVAYLKKRSTGATAPEIAKYAKVNYNTVRKWLGVNQNSIAEEILFFSYLDKPKKCRVTGKHLTTYSLA